jgi:hypothetical protein
MRKAEIALAAAANRAPHPISGVSKNDLIGVASEQKMGGTSKSPDGLELK